MTYQTSSRIIKDDQSPILRVVGITKEFGGVAAVNNCSFEVKKGIITALIGPNGAGKTTLFNLLSGLIASDSGSMFFYQTNITNLASHKISSQGISRTFQLTRLFKNLSIRDNLCVAKECSDLELKKLLLSIGVHKQLSTICSELSYGQQRLVELARALLFPHQLLMLDEPTAGVNPRVRQKLKTIIKNAVSNGTTVLLIEHDMDFVMELSDHVIVLNEGSVLAQGTPNQIKKNKKVLEVYLGK